MARGAQRRAQSGKRRDITVRPDGGDRARPGDQRQVASLHVMTIARRARAAAAGLARRVVLISAAAVLGGFLSGFVAGSSRAGRTAPGRQARVAARDLHGRDGPTPSVTLRPMPARR